MPELGKQPDESETAGLHEAGRDVDLELYRLPEMCRETAEAAVQAGLARSAEEFWRFAVGPKPALPGEGISAIELLLAGIILAHPPKTDDARTTASRLRAAMDALFGEYYREGANDRDDRALLARMDWRANTEDISRSAHRQLARETLAEMKGAGHDDESTVRRLVGKYRELAPEGRLPSRLDADEFRQMLEQAVIAELASLLRSVGVRVQPIQAVEGFLDPSM